jgi:hypothetical protein
MTPEMWTAIIGVGGFSVIIPKLIDGIVAWRSGQAANEKVQNQSILDRLAESERRSQAEADLRRALEEYAGKLRLLLVQAGLAMHKIPPWPDREHPQEPTKQGRL